MKGRQERICLFGGTFDPVHLGHSHIAQIAIEKINLDQLIFLPCKQSPHKLGQEQASEKDRLTMCQLAIQNARSTSVDDFDLTAPEPSYSWRTAEYMQKCYPDARLFWLMGTDQWEALPRWNRFEHLILSFEIFIQLDNSG